MATAEDVETGGADAAAAPGAADGVAGAGDGAATAKSRRISRMDPLVHLREMTKTNQKVTYDNVDECLDFDGRRIHRSTKCGFRLTPPTGPLIDIGSVWYMLYQISSDDGKYTQEITKKRGFTYIGVACRSDLLDYLVGKTDTCAGLVLDVIEGRKQPKADRDPFVDPLTKRLKVAKKGWSPFEDEAPYAASGGEFSYADVLARVRPVKDLDVLVRCPGRSVPNADLILRIAQEELSNHSHGRVHSNVEAQLNSSKMPLHAELEEYLAQDKDAHPIILVPCNKNAPLNLLNAHDFLQHGIFREPDHERKHYFESTRPEQVQVSRNIDGKLWTFEVRDNASRFTKAQWKRTICCVCDGSDWQFKGWPFETTTDLLTTIQGVFIQACGIPVPVHVTQWQVAILRMSALHLEHRFGHIRDAFFTLIEGFMHKLRQKKYANHMSFDAEKRIKERVKPVL